MPKINCMNCCENISSKYGNIPEKAVARAMKRTYLKIGRNLDNLPKVYNEIINMAQKNIAKYAKCNPEDIIFAKSKEDANKICILKLAENLKPKGNNIIISQTESQEIIEICKTLENKGFTITKIPVNQYGEVDLNILERSINQKTILVSIMHTNNETGVMQPIEKIITICKNNNIIFHSDISVSFGRIPLKTKDLDSFTISSKPLGGPHGIAAAITKTNVENKTQILENNAENLAAISGFSKSITLSFNGLSREYNRITGLKAKLINKLAKNFNGIYFNGNQENTLPHIINFCVKGLEGRAQSIVEDVKNCNPAFSASAECVSVQGFSHVLRAMGLSELEAAGAVKIELNRFATDKETDKIFNILGKNLKKTKILFSLL